MLYLKVARSDVHTLNGALVVDFGPTLNYKLEACASIGYTIVMVDIRVTNAPGGLPVHLGGTLEETLSKGPDAFPTRYTRNIANQCRWSQGYAHMRLKDLARDHGGFNISGFEPFYRNTGLLSWEKSQDAPSVSWEPTEVTKVYQFHHSYLRDRIYHYPAPLTRVRHEGVTTFQYRKSEGSVWKVDPGVHGRGYENRTIDPRALRFQLSSASLDSDQTQWSSSSHRNRRPLPQDRAPQAQAQAFYTTDYSLPTTPLSKIFDTTKNGAQYSSPNTSYSAHSASDSGYASAKPNPAVSDPPSYIDGWGNERYLVSDPQSSEYRSTDSNFEDEPQDNPESLYPEVPEYLTPATYQR
jgi:hypothetical protein